MQGCRPHFLQQLEEERQFFWEKENQGGGEQRWPGQRRGNRTEGAIFLFRLLPCTTDGWGCTHVALLQRDGTCHPLPSPVGSWALEQWCLNLGSLWECGENIRASTEKEIELKIQAFAPSLKDSSIHCGPPTYSEPLGVASQIPGNQPHFQKLFDWSNNAEGAPNLCLAHDGYKSNVKYYSSY